MRKTLKVLAIVLGSVIALLLVAFITLTFVFDPNQYKGQIIQTVKEKTGRDLRIEKKIGWSLFPRLGIEAGGLELSNAPGFGKEPFAKIDAAGVGVALLPLFRGHITVDTVYLHGLSLNLAKNAAGRTNWDDLVAASKEAEHRPAKPEAKKPEGAAALAAVTVGRLDVKNANIVWRDQASGSTLAVRDLELATGRFVAGEPVDLHLAFGLTRDRAPPVKVALESRVTATPDSVKLSKLNLALDDSHVTGALEVRNFANPAVRFDLAVDRFDLDRYLPKAPENAAAAAPRAGGAEAPKPIELPLAALRSLDVNGKLRIQQLTAFNLHSSDVLVQVAARGGRIDLGPNQAKLYGGTYRGQTALDVRGRVPALTLNESLSDVELSPLLEDAYRFDKFHGKANLSGRLTAQGFSADQIKSSLNGDVRFAVKDGTIKGADLKKMVDAINTAIRSKNVQSLGRLVPASGDETKFNELSGTAQVRNGVARNDDLRLESPNLLHVSGKGSADLPHEYLDYRVTVGSVPILITGSFSNLKFAPDVQAAAKEAVQKKLQNELEQKLRERLQRLR